MAISEAFSGLSPIVKSFMKEGLSLLEAFTPEQFQVITAASVQAVQSPAAVDVSALARTLSLAEDKAGNLLSATSFLAALTASRTESLSTIISTAQEAGLIPEGGREAVLNFVRVIGDQKQGLLRSLRRTRLAQAVLPSFVRLEMVVDIRIQSDSDGSLAVPIVIAHLDTDADEEHVWFQMERAHVEVLIERLQKTLEDVRRAEQSAEQLSNT
jgi:hypothetical protein